MTRVRNLILFSIPIVGLVIARGLLDFNGLYGQDAHRYFQFVNELDLYFSHNEPLGEFHWPVLYSLSGLVLKRLFGMDPSLALQLISAVSLGVSSVYVYRILRGSQAQHAWLFALVFFTFCPQLLYSSVLCMSDLYAMMWIVLCWYWWFKFKEEGGLNSIIWMSLSAAFAVITRYPAFWLVMLPVAIAFFTLLKQRNLNALWIPIVVLIGCLPDLLIHSSSASISENYLLRHWNFLNLFKSYFETNDGIQEYRFMNLIYVSYPLWHPALFLAGIGFAVLAWIKVGVKKVPMILVASAVIYLLFLGGLEVQSRRFMILVMPLVIIGVSGSGFGMALRRFSVKRLGVVAGVLIGLQFAITAYYLKPYIEMNRFERKLAADMKPYEGSRLYTFYWDMALKTYGCDFQYINLWETEVNEVQNGDRVLFNPEGLRGQWEGSLLMDNWDVLSGKHDLSLIHRWDSGWKLYEVR